MKTPRVAPATDTPSSQDEATTGPPRPRGLRHNTRWLMVFLCFLGMTVNYVDRATISISLPYMTDDLHIGPEWQGVILSMFFVTYALGQLPAGALIDRYGEKRMFAIGGLLWSLVTVGTGFVRGIGTLLFARLALGAGEAPAYPSCAKSRLPLGPRPANGRWPATASGTTAPAPGTAVAAPVVIRADRLAGLADGVLGRRRRGPAVGGAVAEDVPRAHGARRTQRRGSGRT
ncbi:Sialic acid transporter NanT [Streptomyces antimycoticus]